MRVSHPSPTSPQQNSTNSHPKKSAVYVFGGILGTIIVVLFLVFVCRYVKTGYKYRSWKKTRQLSKGNTAGIEDGGAIS